MLDTDVHPRPLDFVGILGLKPPKEYCFSALSDRSFLSVIEMLVKARAQIFT